MELGCLKEIRCSHIGIFLLCCAQDGVERFCRWLQEASEGPLMRVKEFAAKEMVLQGNQVRGDQGVGEHGWVWTGDPDV